MTFVSYICVAGAATLGLFVLRRWRVRQWGWCHSRRQLTRHVAVITGANSGLGREAAFDLASRHATVVLACRSLEHARRAIDEIRKRTRHGELIPMHLDLADLDSVREFADRFCEQFDRLDILMNNAGVAYPPGEKHTTVQGYEAHFGVNHLGHFLLTALLLPRLRSSVIRDMEGQVIGWPPRVVITASSLYKRGHFDCDHIAYGTQPSTTDSSSSSSSSSSSVSSAYCNSKLCNVLFGRRLGRLLNGSGIHVYSACPGWVYTGLFRHSRLSWWKMVAVAPIALLFMRSVRQGVQTQLCCCVDERFGEDSGLLYSDCRRAQYVGPAERGQDAEALWKLSESLAGVSYDLREALHEE